MRSEIKYLVRNEQLPALREMIRPFVELDRYGAGYEDKGYTVRSLYLDTADLRYYHEKMAGIQVRRKLRVRAYNEAGRDDWIFLEIKRKVDDKVFKNRAPTSFDALEQLVRTGDVERYIYTDRHYPRAVADARRFLYHVYRHDLMPTILTVYEREAFHGQFDSTFRITFDRNLRGGTCATADTLYEESGLRPVHPGSFILEVKFDTRFPGWLRTIVGRLGLQNQALSKYCMCLEIGRDITGTKGLVQGQCKPLVHRRSAMSKL